MGRLLLAADIHLGYAETVPGFSSADRLKTFDRLMSLAARHDLLVIAGDLFDSARPAPELSEHVAKAISTLAEKGIHTVMVPGTAEVKKDGSCPGLEALGAGYIHNDMTTPLVLETKSGPVIVYGGLVSPNQSLPILHRGKEQGFHLGLFYTPGDIGGSFFAGLMRERKHLLDFYALGHLHQLRTFKMKDRIIGAYPGTPLATSADETGPRVALSVSFENNSVSGIKRHSIEARRLENLLFDCYGITSDAALASELSSLADSEHKTIIADCIGLDESIDLQQHHRDNTVFVITRDSEQNLSTWLTKQTRQHPEYKDIYTRIGELAQEKKKDPEFNPADLLLVLKTIQDFNVPGEVVCSLLNA